MDDGTMLFVGKLPPSCKDADAQINLRNLFEKYGEVTDFLFNGTHAFLHMATEAQAKEAITYLNGHKIGPALILVAKTTGSTAAAGRKLAQENSKKLAQENAKKLAQENAKKQERAEKEKNSFQSETKAPSLHNQSGQNNVSRQQTDRFTPYKTPNTSDKYDHGNSQSYQNRDTNQHQSSQSMSVSNSFIDKKVNPQRISVIQGHLAHSNKNSTVSPSAVSSMAGNPLTSHVLNTASGQPAANLKMCLYRMFAGQWVEVSKKTTNNDGRASSFLTRAEFTAGTYKMFFDTEDYFKQQSSTGFYPYVEIVFTIERPEEHYHIPLLLSPYGYTTYRGS